MVGRVRKRSVTCDVKWPKADGTESRRPHSGFEFLRSAKLLKGLEQRCGMISPDFLKTSH